MTTPDSSDPLDRLPALAPEVDAAAALRALPPVRRRRGRLAFAVAAAVLAVLAAAAVLVPRSGARPLAVLTPSPGPGAFGPRPVSLDCYGTTITYERRADATLVADDGRVVWSTPLPLGGDEPVSPSLLPGPKPAVAKDVVVVATEVDLRALSLDDGGLVWHTDLARIGGLWLRGDEVLVLTERSTISAYAVRNGKLRWSLPLGAAVVGTPVLLDDGGLAVLVSRGGSGVVPDQESRRELVVVAGGKVRWSFDSGLPSALGHVVVAGGSILWRYGQTVAALSAKDGTVRWKGVADERSDLQDAGSVVVASTRANELTALVAFRPADGSVAWRRDLEQFAFTFADGRGRVYRTTYGPNGLLARLDPASGGDLWTSQVDGGFDLRVVGGATVLWAIEQGGGRTSAPGSIPPAGLTPSPSRRLVQRSVVDGRVLGVAEETLVAKVEPGPADGIIGRRAADGPPSAVAYDATVRRRWDVVLASPPEAVAAAPGATVVVGSIRARSCDPGEPVLQLDGTELLSFGVA